VDDEEIKPIAETVDLIYERLKDASEAVIAQVQSLDGKAIQAFSAATVLIGLVAVMAGIRKPPSSVHMYLTLSLGGYVATVILTAVHLWPRRVRGTRWAFILWTQHYLDEPFALKKLICEKIEGDTVKNGKLTTWKTRTLSGVLLATAFQGVCVALAVLAVIGGG
jgi:hypothetical protein